MHESYRYQHRSSERGLQRDRAAREKVLGALAAHRQQLSQYRARIRNLTGVRNETVARAIGDGVRISTVAAAIGETIPRIREIALAFEAALAEERAFERPGPHSASRDEHLRSLRKITKDLASAVTGRASLEEQLGVLVTHAYRLGFTDETHLACMAGVSPESVHQRLRGLRRLARG